jgi:hypothetical protein
MNPFRFVISDLNLTPGSNNGDNGGSHAATFLLLSALADLQDISLTANQSTDMYAEVLYRLRAQSGCVAYRALQQLFASKVGR